MKNTKYVVGIDEVGRGPLAGPVSVCAFRMKISEYAYISFHAHIRDSKKLSEKKRNEYFKELQQLKKEGKCDFAVVSQSAKIIDTKGITYAIRESLKRALQKVGAQIDDMILLDGGLRAEAKFTNQKTIIKGDEKELSIACASIVAKVTRDAHMRRMAKRYPDYGFERHVGYGTVLHRERIQIHGFIPLHRRTFCKNIKV